MFADRNEKCFNDAWCTGKLNNWQNLSRKIKTHESSHSHLKACIAYSNFKNSNNTESLLKNGNEKWKDVLIIILDIIVTLARCNIPLRGRRASLTAPANESGNFLNIVLLVSRHNVLLKNHIEYSINKIKHLSPEIQNEFISLAADRVLKDIVIEINNCSFFSLILDATIDVSKTDQLSVIIRFTKIKPSEKVEIEEVFLGFIEIDDQSAESITDELLKFLNNLGINISKCGGQSYDGASVMSGKYSGIQARLKKWVPSADYIHCCNHNINLVLNDSVNDVVEIKNFYAILSEIYNFFSSSLPRWQKLKSETPINKNGIIPSALRKLCPTRWSSRFDTISAIKNNFLTIMNCLHHIVLTSNKKPEIDEAKSLINKMKNYDFIILLVYQYNVLKHINHLSKIMQYKSIKLDEASKWLNNASNELKILRSNFEMIDSQAETVAKSWNSEPKLKEKRSRKIKKFYDELASDSTIPEPINQFRIKIYYKSLDVMIN